MEEDNALINVLYKRAERKPSTRFPTLPQALVTARFRELQKKYRSLGQRKCKHAKQDKVVTDIENDRVAVLLEAQLEANTQIAQACKQFRVRVRAHFPRRAKTHPLYEQLTPFRESYQKLKDLARKYKHRTHYQEQAENMLRQAWSLL